MVKTKKDKTGIAEFDFISRFMLPLAKTYKGSFNLTDDIAIFPKNSKTDYAVTIDTIAEGTHFLSSASPKQIAQKLLGSNLSDLASCGATPKFYLMTGNLASDMNAEWLEAFTQELADIQERYGMVLIGGDTVRTGSKKFFSATLIGEVPKGKALLRSKAKAGDDIYVSGVIGEAWTGLQILTNAIKNSDISSTQNNRQYYIDCHYNPKPQIRLGKQLIKLANSCTDISDGLLKDLSNILDTSNVSALLKADMIPVALKNPEYFITQITAGDDYQLLFTTSPAKAKDIASLKFPITKIGKIIKNDNKKIKLIDSSGKEIKFKGLGYEH